MADLTKDRLADTFRIPRASRYTAPESEEAALPIIYGDLTIPARSSSGVYTLPKIDTAGAGTYCVAGHAVHGSVSLFDDDGLIAPGDYTLNLADNFQGKGTISTAAFSVAPSGAVTGVCKGRKNASGNLIENPAQIVKDLMVNFWGFADQDIDQNALSRATERAEALGYAAAGLIQNNHPPADVLTELLGDFLGRYEIDPFGRLRLTMGDKESTAIQPVKVLPRFVMTQVVREINRDSVINQVPLLYAKNYTDGSHIRHDDGEATKDTASQRLYGVRTPPDGRLTLDWVRGSQAAATVQARIVERFGEPASIITIGDATLRALELEPDDYAVFSVAWMRSEKLEPLVNQIGQVLTLTYELREQTMEIRLRDTGHHLTKGAIANGTETAGGGNLAGAQRDTAVYA